MQNKRFNSDGEELFFFDGVWLPKKCIPTKEQIDNYYARFSHPVINWPKVIAILIFSLCFIIGSVLIPLFLKISAIYKVLIPIILITLFVSAHLRRFSIFLIKLYQHFAPMKLRERCVFTPTCSDYMISAIKKYGKVSPR